MSAKIMGANYDDLAKLMGADLIVAGTAVIAEVRTGETFYAGSTTLLTGNMPTVAIVPASNAYPAGYHVGNGGGLTAVDGDLIAANIADGVTIFNVLGTLSATPAEDDIDSDFTNVTNTDFTGKYFEDGSPGGLEIYETITLTVTDTAVLIGTCTLYYKACHQADSNKMQLIIDGTVVAESGFLLTTLDGIILHGFKEGVASGARTIQLGIFKTGGAQWVQWCHRNVGGGAVIA